MLLGLQEMDMMLLIGVGKLTIFLGKENTWKDNKRRPFYNTYTSQQVVASLALCCKVYLIIKYPFFNLLEDV